MSSNFPRLSGGALNVAAKAMRLSFVRKIMAKHMRRQLGIEALLALDLDARSPMPLDYRPVQARPVRSVVGDFALPEPPTAIPSARSWTAVYESQAATPTELVERTILNADKLANNKPSMNCFTHIDEEGALRDAAASTERWANGTPKGPLDGVVVPIKEMTDIDGAGGRIGADFLPERSDTRDATSVARLREAGAIILGLTPMVEMGMSPMGANPNRDMPRNAHAFDRVAGGSSTGSAVAVATGLAPVTLGCDGGGSLRIPAAYNGIFSIKPTAGRVSRHLDGFGGSMDHFGPMAASPHDLAIFLEACAGPDPLDSITDNSPPVRPGEFTAALGRGVAGLRIGVLQSEIDAADPEIAKACRIALAALEEDGADLVDVSISLAEHAAAIGFVVIGLETYVELLDQERQGWRGMTPDNQVMMSLFEAFHPADYVDAQCFRTSLRQQCASRLRDVDVLALPTTARVAPTVSDAQMQSGFSDIEETQAACRFTFLGNLTGLPCGQAPVGSGESGMPVGLQIVGDAFAENEVLAVLAHLERIGAASVRSPVMGASPLDS
ncbi:MAG: amidase [Pseudomonadota bacterium]